MIKFNLHSSQFFLTHPKCFLDPVLALARFQERVQRWNVKLIEYVIAREEHKDGSLHLHSYLKVGNKLNLKNPDCWDIASTPGDDVISFHGNYQTCRSAKNVIKYCVKGGVYITNIQDKVDQYRATQDKMEVYKEVINGNVSLLELVNLYPSLGMIQNYSRLKANLTALQLDLKKTAPRKQVCGKWIIGRPGVGKSHFARELIRPGVARYVKAQHRWWDQYQGESIVVLEDLSPPGPKSSLTLEELGYLLKIWTDRWECSGEVKGGTVKLVYNLFVVTSNYSLDDFGFDNECLAALKRRFVIIGMSDRDEAEVERPELYEGSNTQDLIEVYFKKKVKKVSIEEVEETIRRQPSLFQPQPQQPQNPEGDVP